MNESDLHFAEIKKQYCNGDSGFGYSGILDANKISLRKNDHAIQITKLTGETVEILYTVDKVITFEQSGKVNVSELAATIDEWAKEHQTKSD